MSFVATNKKTKKSRSSSVTGTTATKTKKEKKKVKGRSNSVSQGILGDLDEAAIEMSFYLMDMQPRTGRKAVMHNEVDLKEAVMLRDNFYLKMKMQYKAQAIQCIGQAHYLASTIRLSYISKGYNPTNRQNILCDREFLLAYLNTISGIKDAIKEDLEPIREPRGKSAKKLKNLPDHIKKKHLIPRMNAIFTVNKEIIAALNGAKKMIDDMSNEILALTA